MWREIDRLTHGKINIVRSKVIFLKNEYIYDKLTHFRCLSQQLHIVFFKASAFRIKSSVNRLIKESIDQRINQRINHLVNQLINESID